MAVWMYTILQTILIPRLLVMTPDSSVYATFWAYFIPSMLCIPTVGQVEYTKYAALR